MFDLHGVWMIEQDGQVIYEHEFYVQGSEQYDTALLGSLLSHIKKAVLNSNENQIKVTELEDAKIVTLNDTKLGVLIVIKCRRDADYYRINVLIDFLQELYDRYSSNFDEFKREVEELLRFDSESAKKTLIENI